MGQNRVQTLLSHIESRIRMNISAQRMNVSVQNGCAIPTEWMYLFNDNQFQSNGFVCLVNGCVWSEQLLLVQLNKCVCSKWLRLYKGHNSTPK